MGPLLYLNLTIIFLFVLLWIGIVLFLRIKKKKSTRYLILFSIFYIYMFKVLDYTLFQIQSLLLLKQFMPNLMLRGQTETEAINVIPLMTLTFQDLKTSLLNILLFVPFGLGLPFISNMKMKKIVLTGMLVSIGIEIMQFVTGVIGGTTFRIADSNDLIFNTLGVVIGYILFKGSMHTYLRNLFH